MAFATLHPAHARSSGFGSCPIDSPRLNTAALVVRLRPCRFPYAFPDTRVRLVNQAHSLVRFQNVRRNTGFPIFLLETRVSVVVIGTFRAPSLYRQLISRPIAPPFVGCFSAFAHATCSLSVLRCLVFAVDARDILEDIQPRYSGADSFRTTRHYGTVTLCRALFKRLPVEVREVIVSPNTTLPVKASVWTASRSFAITNDIAFAFFSCRY